MAIRASKQPARIGVVLAISAAYGRGVFKGIAEYVNQHPGWDVIRTGFTLGPDGVAQMRRLALDGLIAGFSAPEAEELAHRVGVPCVNVSNQLRDSMFPRVISDDAMVGRMAAEHLLGRGWQQFAFVGMRAARFSTERGRGFSRCLKEQDVTCSTYNLDKTSKQALLDWLRSLPVPTAILAANDHRAFNLVGTCRKAGLLVPGDAAVMGVDNDEVEATMAGISLTSVELNTEAIGHAAAALLGQLIAGRKPPRHDIRIPPLRVVPRDSTDANPVPDPRIATVVRHIEASLTNTIYVEELCRLAHMPRRMFERRFRELIGRSPYDHILQLRLARAKELLSTTDSPITRIASECGIDAKKFAGLFRAKVGLTPSAYRQVDRSRVSIIAAP